jgi:small subunit ribosomal protein S1
MVLDVDMNRERISLGLKQTQEDPWKQLVRNFPVGSIVEGKVTKLVTFGAFVELGQGVEGLVHISEMAKGHVEKPEDVVAVGQEVHVKVMDVDLDKRRISLSIRAANAELGLPDALEGKEGAEEGEEGEESAEAVAEVVENENVEAEGLDEAPTEVAEDAVTEEIAAEAEAEAAAEEAPAGEEAPAAEEPAAEEPAAEEAPAEEPAAEEAPAAEEEPAAEEAPAAEEPAAEEAPAAEDEAKDDSAE